MRYSNHEYWSPRSAQVVLAVVGLCMFFVGVYFGIHYSGISNEAGILYQKALTDKMSIQTRMIKMPDNPTTNSTPTYQSLFREQDELKEAAKNAVEQRNNFGSKANRFISLSLFGACVALVPFLFYLIRVPNKFLVMLKRAN